MKQRQNLLRILLLVEVTLLLLFIYGYFRWTIEWRLNGPQAMAEITDKTSSTDGLYFVSYRYAVNGIVYTRKHQVIKDYYDAVVPGQAIEVTYSPADVSVSGIGGQGIGDYGIERIPGTFFDLKFLGLVLPGLIGADLVLILVVLIANRIMIKRAKEQPDTREAKLSP